MGILQNIASRFFSQGQQETVLYKRLRERLGGEKLLYVGELLRFAARQYTHEAALISSGKTISYKELYFRALLLSKTLQQRGVCRGDRVVLMHENSAEFYIAYFAILQAGAIVAPLNLFLHEKELAQVIQDAQPVAIVTNPELQQKCKQAVAFAEEGNANIQILLHDLIDWATPVAQSIEEVEKVFTPICLNDNELALLLYTSGTTGSPKGVMLSSRNIMTNTLQSAARLGVFQGVDDSCCRERFFAALPLFHVFAQNSCIWLPFMVGATVIVVRKIDRCELLEGLKQSPTIFFGVPALYGLLCLMKTAPLDSVRLFVSGGDAVPMRIRSAFALVYGRKICSGYGLTEASPVIAVHIDNQEVFTNVVGPPLVGITCDVRDDHGVSLPKGQVGTLWVRGDNVMLGYYNAPEATQKVLQDGWLCTGDLVLIDAHDNIAIMGRSKDLIIHKGFNIYPQEIENVLMTHPLVTKAAVIGRDDVLSGQVPVAFVAITGTAADREKVLRDFCAQHLAAYKIPRKIICLDDLPMSATGKIDKKQLSGEIA